MASRAEKSSSSKRLPGTPSGNASSSGVEGKAARKVKKPVVKVWKDDDEDTATPEKKRKPARTGSSTKPEFQPEKARDVNLARKSRQPVKEDPDTSSEESGPSSATTARRGHEQPEKSASTSTTSSAASPRTDQIGQAILAIERGNLDDFRRLVPSHVRADAVSSKGYSLLDIARFQEQPGIYRYLEQELTNQQLTGRAIKAIETVDIDALKKLVPAQVQPDAVSRNGRSLLKIARYQQQQLEAIINYLESQTGEGGLAFPVLTAAAPDAIPGARGKKMLVIEFYDKHSGYYEFTNFYQGKPIEIDGVSWKTAEHYFQAKKFDGDFAQLKSDVRAKDSAREAYKAAASNKAYWRSDWQQVKVSVMRRALYAKFSQDKNLRKSLCGTGNAQLVEASPKDAFWGYGPDGKGKNMLGKLLMELRTELQDEM